VDAKLGWSRRKITTGKLRSDGKLAEWVLFTPRRPIPCKAQILYTRSRFAPPGDIVIVYRTGISPLGNEVKSKEKVGA